MFVGKLVRIAGAVVEGVAEGVLGGAQVLVKGTVATVARTAEVLADGVDRTLASAYAEVKATVAEAKKATDESKEEGK